MANKKKFTEAVERAEIRMLQQKYKEVTHKMGAESVSDFRRQCSSELPIESWAALILRDQSPGIKNLMVMMGELGFKRSEIAQALRDRGENMLARIVDTDTAIGG